MKRSVASTGRLVLGLPPLTKTRVFPGQHAYKRLTLQVKNVHRNGHDRSAQLQSCRTDTMTKATRGWRGVLACETVSESRKPDPFRSAARAAY